MGDTYARVYVRVSRMTRSCIQDSRRAWKASSTMAKGGESPEVKLPECSYLLNTLFNYSCVNVAFLPLPSMFVAYRRTTSNLCKATKSVSRSSRW